MFWRAVFAFIFLPGVVVFLVPVLAGALIHGTADLHVLGVLPLALGTLLLLWCVRDFYVAGKGTLAPWRPPRKLVVIGLYRYTRNPMYLAVALILLGWAGTFWSVYLLVYLIALVTFFQWLVVRTEEPSLRKLHGEAYERYRIAVPRWLI